MSKLVTLTVAAGAYVLGAKAGRKRYEQISTKAQSLWSDPRVQRKKREAVGLAKDTASRAKEQATRTGNPNAAPAQPATSRTSP
ncbi:MAG: hypothetical protein ABI873_07290 [Marmoricola sp.]